jgi:hypothetical protein
MIYRSLLVVIPLAHAVAAEPCAPAIADDQLKAVIGKARAAQKDLPAPFKDTDWKIQRNGCYYAVAEWPVPAVPDSARIWWINEKGVLVDLMVGNSDKSPLKCPGKPLADADLAAIVAKERAARKDLPPAFDKQTVVVVRSRCTYIYIERLAGTRSKQTFVIDPLGELMDFTQSPG